MKFAKKVVDIARKDGLIGKNAKLEKNICVLCKGSKMLCGRSKCPILIKLNFHSKYKLLDKTELDGSSPPSVFIGRIGYPNVYIGPMIPPEVGDTSIIDTPERWFGKSIEEIADFRIKLVRGMYKTNIRDRNKIIELTREIALSDNE